MLPDTKPSNPKDTVGITKLALGLIPFSGLVETALAFVEGRFKYGQFNWRVAGVRSSVYADALLRHFGKWYNGEDRDPKTRVHHLGSVMACCAILIDAVVCGKLEDDRPPAAPVGKMIDDAADTVAHLKALFADHSPRQWTIADSEETGDAWEPLAPGDTAAIDPTDEAYAAAVGAWGPPADDAALEMAWGKKAQVDFATGVNDTRAVAKTYSVSPSAGVTLGPYSSQEALDKALYRWTEYREVLGETEDQRAERLRREQAQ